MGVAKFASRLMYSSLRASQSKDMVRKSSVSYCATKTNNSNSEKKVVRSVLPCLSLLSCCRDFWHSSFGSYAFQSTVQKAAKVAVAFNQSAIELPFFQFCFQLAVEQAVPYHCMEDQIQTRFVVCL